MNVLYEKSFLKDIEKVKDKKVLDRISDTIDTVKSIQNLETLPNVKKLKGHASAFRIRIGDSRFLHRRDIYGYFP